VAEGAFAPGLVAPRLPEPSVVVEGRGRSGGSGAKLPDPAGFDSVVPAAGAVEVDESALSGVLSRDGSGFS
jgi:hypothetical protein